MGTVDQFLLVAKATDTGEEGTSTFLVVNFDALRLFFDLLDFPEKENNCCNRKKQHLLNYTLTFSWELVLRHQILLLRPNQSSVIFLK